MSELKKCPFCGGKHIIKTYINWNPALLCSCGAVMTVPMDWRTNKEEELERKWDTRKPVDDVVEALEEIIKQEEKIFNLFEKGTFSHERACHKLTAYNIAIQIIKEKLN